MYFLPNFRKNPSFKVHFTQWLECFPACLRPWLWSLSLQNKTKNGNKQTKNPPNVFYVCQPAQQRIHRLHPTITERRLHLMLSPDSVCEEIVGWVYRAEFWQKRRRNRNCNIPSCCYTLWVMNISRNFKN